MRTFGTGQLAERYPGVPVWRLRRALDTLVAIGHEVARVGTYRVLREDQLPALEAELRRVGALKAEPASA